MTQIAFQDGKAVFVGGKAGTGQACCCSGNECIVDADCGFDEIGSLFCCNGICSETACTECAGGYTTFGWFTANGVRDFRALLSAAGYVDIVFTYRLFGGVAPYTDGCGQTFYDVAANCCGTTNGCAPAQLTGNVSQLAGPGNQFPPCGAEVVNTATVNVCCDFP